MVEEGSVRNSSFDCCNGSKMQFKLSPILRVHRNEVRRSWILTAINPFKEIEDQLVESIIGL